MEPLLAANTQPLPRPTIHARWRQAVSAERDLPHGARDARPIYMLTAVKTAPTAPTIHAPWRQTVSAAPRRRRHRTHVHLQVSYRTCVSKSRDTQQQTRPHTARGSQAHHDRYTATTRVLAQPLRRPRGRGIYYTQARNLLHGAPSLAAPCCSTLAADVMVRSANAAGDGAGQLAPLRQRLRACPTSYFFLASASHSSWNSAKSKSSSSPS